MVPLRWSVFVRVIVLLLGLSTAWAEAELNAKVAKRFKVNWSSVSHDKTVNNPKVSLRGQETSERLSLSCEIEILDPDLVLGTSREGIVTKLTDRQGRSVDTAPSGPVQRGSMHMRYEGLRYRPRFVQPPQPSRWLALVQSVLKLPRRARPRPELVSELQPSRMQIQLDAGLRERTGGEIGRAKGHFYALMAESLEHVEVPFEPNDNWVRLTPDVEIQVREARCTGSSYRFKIETQPRGGASMRPLSVEDSVPSRIVIDRQLIGADGKPTREFSGYRRLPASVGGSGSGSRIGRIEKIRFVIAVNPTHYKIPFELEHIPLPKP